MKNDIPEIDALIDGINDPDIMLAQESSDTKEAVSTSQDEELVVPCDKYWQDFLKHLETSDERNDKSERLVCRLDRDLADSLDDCVIYNRSRSDMVNAIVRAFFDAYLPQLAQFRREKKSLFTNFKLGDHEKEKD